MKYFRMSPGTDMWKKAHSFSKWNNMEILENLKRRTYKDNESHLRVINTYLFTLYIG